MPESDDYMRNAERCRYGKALYNINSTAVSNLILQIISVICLILSSRKNMSVIVAKAMS